MALKTFGVFAAGAAGICVLWSIMHKRKPHSINLTADDVQHVKESWAELTAKHHSEAVAAMFYNNLEDAAPHMFRTVFRNTNMAEQGAKLIDMISHAVKLLDNPLVLFPVLHKAGVRHVAYGVREEFYAPFAKALFKTLHDTLGQHFSNSVRASWERAFDVIKTLMQKGANSPEGVQARSEAALKLRNMEVMRTWAHVSHDPQGFAAMVYRNLQESNPSVMKDLLANANAEEEGKKLMTIIDTGVHLLNKPEELRRQLREMGSQHIGFGPVEAHYPLFGIALIKTLKDGLGTAFTQDIEQDWLHAFGVIQSAVLEGALSKRKQ